MQKVIVKISVGMLFFALGFIFMLVYNIIRVKGYVGSDVDWYLAFRQGLIMGAVCFIIGLLSSLRKGETKETKK